MRNRLRTVMFGIGLMILLAQPAFAEELGQANITPRTKMAEIRSNPSVVGAGIYTYSLDQDRVLDRMYLAGVYPGRNCGRFFSGHGAVVLFPG